MLGRIVKQHGRSGSTTRPASCPSTRGSGSSSSGWSRLRGRLGSGGALPRPARSPARLSRLEAQMLDDVAVTRPQLRWGEPLAWSSPPDLGGRPTVLRAANAHQLT